MNFMNMVGSFFDGKAGNVFSSGQSPEFNAIKSFFDGKQGNFLNTPVQDTVNQMQAPQQSAPSVQMPVQPKYGPVPVDGVPGYPGQNDEPMLQRIMRKMAGLG